MRYFLVLIICNIFTFANSYFLIENEKNGMLQIYKNQLKIDLSNIQDIEEPANAKEVDLDLDGIPEIQIEFVNLGMNLGRLSLFLKYNENKNKFEEIKTNTHLYNVIINHNNILTTYCEEDICYKEISSYNRSNNTITLQSKQNIKTSQSVIFSQKTQLYKTPSEESITKMYLIAGDKADLLEEKIGENGIKWYNILYHGKKNINAWIKADESINIDSENK